MFTEFMEQRAPGHTVLDDKIYSKGMLDFKADIARAKAKLDFLEDPEAYDKSQALRSFQIACDAAILFAERHAALARELASKEPDLGRRGELEKIADVCSRVPAHAPRDFHEALQYLLVLSPRGHYRAQWLGFLQSGPPRSAPPSVLPKGTGGRHADPRESARAARMLLHQIQQPSRRPRRSG